MTKRGAFTILYDTFIVYKIHLQLSEISKPIWYKTCQYNMYLYTTRYILTNDTVPYIERNTKQVFITINTHTKIIREDILTENKLQRQKLFNIKCRFKRDQRFLTSNSHSSTLAIKKKCDDFVQHNSAQIMHNTVYVYFS